MTINSCLILLLILLVIWQVVLQVEHFSDSPLFIWKTSVNTTPLYLFWNTSYDCPWKNTITDIKNLQLVLTDKDLPLANLLSVIDAYSFARNIDNRKILTVVPERSSLLFLKPRGQLVDLSLRDIVNADQIIGYTSQYQRELIEIVALSLSIEKSRLNFKKISFETINDQLFTVNTIDILSVFTPVNNSELQNKIDPKFKIDFVDYQDVDINLVKYYFPPALLNNTSLDIYFPSYHAEFPIKMTLDIDLLLVGDEQLEDNLDLRSQLFQLIVATDNYDVNNLYNMWFPIFSQTEQYILTQNAHTQSRDNLTILEQFADYFEYTPSINVTGYYDSHLERLELNSNLVQGVPLQPNWKVILQNQDRSEENGEYFVHSDTRILNKVLVFGLAEDEFTVTKNTLTPNKKVAAIDHIPWDKITSNNKLSIPAINRTGHRSGDDILLDVGEVEDTDERWGCTDPTIKIKGLCVSKYDIDGNPKKKLTYWDRRCENSSECPFYQANKNYRNYFGGCDNGYCQLPIGMRARAYRMYDPDFKPLCYGCQGINHGDCCTDQENREKYPHLKSPDYVYELDSFERRSSGL